MSTTDRGSTKTWADGVRSHDSTNGPWFGVPLGNFYGWFCVVLSFSLLLRLGRRWLPPGEHRWLGKLGVPLIAVPLSVVALMQLLTIYTRLLEEGLSAWLIVGSILVFSAAAPLAFVRSSCCDHRLDGIILAVPLFFHLFFCSALFWAGIYGQAPLLVPIALTMFLVGLVLHLWPSWRRLFAAPRAPAVHQAAEGGS